jgi:hypothetical protein
LHSPLPKQILYIPSAHCSSKPFAVHVVHGRGFPHSPMFYNSGERYLPGQYSYLFVRMYKYKCAISSSCCTSLAFSLLLARAKGYRKGPEKKRPVRSALENVARTTRVSMHKKTAIGRSPANVTFHYSHVTNAQCPNKREPKNLSVIAKIGQSYDYSIFGCV